MASYREIAVVLKMFEGTYGKPVTEEAAKTFNLIIGRHPRLLVAAAANL